MPKESLGFSDEQLERHAKLKAEKMATVITGDDVIHLEYFYGILDKNDIQTYETDLQKLGVRLSHFDKSGLVFASLDDYTLQVFFGLSSPIVKLLGEGVLTNIVWETVKAIAISSWRKVKARNTQPHGKKINFGLKMKFKDDRLASFKLNSDFSEETTLKAMDMILQYVNIQKSDTAHDALPDFCEYDEKTDTWCKVDVMESFRKMASEQKVKRTGGRSSGS